MAYTTQHKILLQTIMHEGLLEETKMKQLVIEIFKDGKVSLVINQINDQLQSLNMVIRKAECEITGQVYWIFVSTVLDDVMKLQEEFSKAQVAFLRNIFSEIITSENKCIQSTLCLNLCSLPDVKLQKVNAEKFLRDMVYRKWLIYKDGHYYMGVRSIAELMPYFKASYGSNLRTCSLCKQVIFHNKKCGNCESLLHLYCLKQCSMKCPNCNTRFSNINDSASTITTE